MKLFPYQVEGIDLICNKYHDVLLADHPGAGKTCQAIIAADKLNCKRIIVICPASLRENWRREFKIWSIKPREICCIYDSKYNAKADVLIISYELATRYVDTIPGVFDLMIIDEAHYLKSQKSKRTKAILGVLWNKAKKHICITGTPLPNGRASEGFSLFNKLAPSIFSHWFTYANTYCVREETPWGVNFDKSKNLELLGLKCKQYFMIRRKREETIGQLPPLVRQQVALSGISFETDLNEETVLNAVDKNYFAPFATMRQELGLQKVIASVEYISTLLEESKHIVVFAHHLSVIARLKTAFMEKNISFVTVTGESTPKEKQAAVDSFQAGQAQIFLGSLLAANVGITLTKAHDVVFVEYDWVPENNVQAEGRCYRIGQTEITRSHYLTCPDSIDDKILNVVLSKQNNIKKVLGESAA